MAYLSKTACNNLYETWSKLIRFICGDSNTAGRDWQITKYEIDETSANNVQYKDFSGNIEITALDTPLELPTVSITNYTFNLLVKNETIGTGDGTTTSFSGTLTKTPINTNSVIVYYTIAGTNYTANDDGNGNITGTNISSGSIDYNTGSISITFSTAPDNGSNITVDYKSSLTEGTDYTLDDKLGLITCSSTGKCSVGNYIDYNYTFKRGVFYLKNTGIGGTDDINIIIKLLIYNQENEGHFQLNAFYGYDDLGNIVQKSNSNYAVCVWNNPNNLWVFSNKQRIIIVAESEGFYSCGYVGFALRYALPSEYPKPLAIFASHQASNDYSSVLWHDDQSTARWFLYRGYLYMDDGGVWKSGSLVQPHVYASDLLTINYPDTFPKWIFPILLYPTDNFIVGAYDGVYWLPDTSFTSESEITDENGNTYIIFPDIFRNDDEYWHAIKEE